MSRRLGVLAVVAALSGCGLPFESDPELVANTCDSSADCGDAACAPVGEARICVAKSADLAGVIFQLEGTTTDGVTVSHVFSKGVSLQGESEGGAIVNVDLDAPSPFALTGRLLQPGGAVPGCTADDGSLPVKVEARPTSELAGLSQVFSGTSTLAGPAGETSHRFLVNVPEGTYDVYVVPQPLPSPACDAVHPSPPRLFPGIVVDQDVKLEPTDESPLRLTGSVIAGSDRDLTGFTVELVDAKRGVPVSDTSPLQGPPEDGAFDILGGAAGDDEAGVAYYTTDNRSLLLRIADPEGALVVHWSFESLDLDGNGSVVCDLGDLIANPKDLTAAVLDEQKRPVPAATVTIKSVVLTGSASKNASFRVTTTSDADGNIHVQLVPGTYQVLVTPSGEDGPASLEDDWVVSPDAGCCGKSFELTARSLLTARVSTALGDPAASVPVLASPVLPGTRSYFENVIESLELLPRQAATTTDGSGAFATPVDPGLYDLTIRAAATTGFPWLVVPSVVVAPVDQQPATTLEALTVPSPAVFVGSASAQGVPVARATLRAFLPLAEGDAKDATPVRVVQIGEAIVGDDGTFILPVPPTVARDVPDPTTSTTTSSSTSSSTGTFQP